MPPKRENGFRYGLQGPAQPRVAVKCDAISIKKVPLFNRQTHNKLNKNIFTINRAFFKPFSIATARYRACNFPSLYPSQFFSDGLPL